MKKIPTRDIIVQANMLLDSLNSVFKNKCVALRRAIIPSDEEDQGFFVYIIRRDLEGLLGSFFISDESIRNRCIDMQKQYPEDKLSTTLWLAIRDLIIERAINRQLY